LNTSNRVSLSSLSNGDVFIASLENDHGHQTGVVFSERGILVLSGPGRFTAFQSRPHDGMRVVPCPEWRDVSVRVPSGHTAPHRETPRLGRIVVDEEGMHLTCQWQDNDGAPQDFFSVRLGTWSHSGLPSGLEIDAWSLVRTDASGNEVVLAGFPD
jgi:hypothetical protein